jgi:hypothetical protein
MDDGTFPALLKTLSDSSEEVIKHDLQLIAQISTSSEESYFRAFMHNLLELFSTDRRLLETRGSLIIRQLCLNLNTEKIYRTFAELLEREEVSLVVEFRAVDDDPLFEDLEFAGVIVQKLSLILMTSPELAEFRRRLKSLETRVCGSHRRVYSPDDLHTFYSKTVRCYSRSYTSLGVITQRRCSPCVYSHKRTNTHRISYTSCELNGPWPSLSRSDPP